MCKCLKEFMPSDLRVSVTLIVYIHFYRSEPHGVRRSDLDVLVCILELNKPSFLTSESPRVMSENSIEDDNIIN